MITSATSATDTPLQLDRNIQQQDGHLTVQPTLVYDIDACQAG